MRSNGLVLDFVLDLRLTQPCFPYILLFKQYTFIILLNI